MGEPPGCMSPGKVVCLFKHSSSGNKSSFASLSREVQRPSLPSKDNWECAQQTVRGIEQEDHFSFWQWMGNNQRGFASMTVHVFGRERASHFAFGIDRAAMGCCRNWLYEHLESKGFDLGFRQWMGSNLTPKGTWTFDPRCAQVSSSDPSTRPTSRLVI